MTKGNIIIDPFDEKYLNPCSVDLTLAPDFKVYRRIKLTSTIDTSIPRAISDSCLPKLMPEYGTIDCEDWIEYERPLDPREENETESLILPEYGYVLTPGEVYLYRCNERIGVKGDICAKVEGKSSLGRLGLFIHVTAGFIDTGFEGSLVLELVATRPIIVYPNMKICQIKFERVEGEIGESYDQKAGSKYHLQEGVQQSLYHKNFENES